MLDCHSYFSTEVVGREAPHRALVPIQITYPVQMHLCIIHFTLRYLLTLTTSLSHLPSSKIPPALSLESIAALARDARTITVDWYFPC
jgi:hypothetical protein